MNKTLASQPTLNDTENKENNHHDATEQTGEVTPCSHHIIKMRFSIHYFLSFVILAWSGARNAEGNEIDFGSAEKP